MLNFVVGPEDVREGPEAIAIKIAALKSVLELNQLLFIERREGYDASDRFRAKRDDPDTAKGICLPFDSSGMDEKVKSLIVKQLQEAGWKEVNIQEDNSIVLVP